MKKRIHTWNDAWLTSRLSHWPIQPVYFIVDGRISGKAELAVSNA